MTIRSLVLFTHVVGVLALFIGMAFEWLSLASLRRATTSEQAASWVRLYGGLRRVYGPAFVVLLLSGVYLASGGAFKLAWVRVSLGLMILMGILGGPAVGSRARAMRKATGNWQDAVHPWLRASLFMRIALGLAVVYLMIGKPVLTGSLLVTGMAVAVGLVASFLGTAMSSPSSASAANLKGRSA